MKCWGYKAKNKKEKDNCINCRHWGGKQCKDEALILAEWDKRHRSYELMMQQNRGVRIEYDSPHTEKNKLFSMQGVRLEKPGRQKKAVTLEIRERKGAASIRDNFFSVESKFLFLFMKAPTPETIC